MPKNIILLSDGTGNSSAKLFKTNVWRLYEALDLTDPNKQIAYYDDGVGTSSFKLFAVLGGIFGFGLKRNVIDLYSFLCRHYESGDRIYGFGFSRGSFTIRVLIGMIARHGVVPYDGNEAKLALAALDVYRLNRRSFAGGLVTPLRKFRDVFVRMWRGWWRNTVVESKDLIPVDQIRFVGVWDTVEAYGGPLEELTRAIDYFVWPLSMPDRYMSAKIQRACHALALDDERQAFWPVLWDEKHVSGPKENVNLTKKWTEHFHRTPDGPIEKSWNESEWVPETKHAKENLSAIDQQRISQVWFTGMHSDVGGGYPQDGLSFVTLQWMIDRAEAYELRIDPVKRSLLTAQANPFDKLNDSRHGLGGYYRYKPRKLADIYALEPVKPTLARDLGHARQAIQQIRAGQPSPAQPSPASMFNGGSPIIHESVFRRIEAGTEGYSPIVLPAAYQTTNKDGELVPNIETHYQAQWRAHQQERAWNQVWGRRVVYFLTLAASLFLGFLPIYEVYLPRLPAVSPAEAAIPLIDLVGKVLPGFASWWLDAFKKVPEYVVACGLLIAVLLAWGGRLQQAVFDKMRQYWRKLISGKIEQDIASNPIKSRLFRVRTHPLYRGLFYFWLHYLGPILFAILIYVALIYMAAIVTARVFFPAAVAVGAVCTPAKKPSAEFNTKSLCHATGVSVVKDKTYTITLEIPETWEDGRQDNPFKRGIETGPQGFGSDRASGIMKLGLPLRRHMSENWFELIVRVEQYGAADHKLTFERRDDPCKCKEPSTKGTIKATFTARKSGEVFLYVNDSVIGLPWLPGLFYDNNFGSANVSIEESNSGR